MEQPNNLGIMNISDLVSQKMYFRQETAYHGSVEDTLVWLFQNHEDWLRPGNIIKFMRAPNFGAYGIFIPGGPNANYNTILEFSYYDDRNINMYRMDQGRVISSRTI